MLNLAGEGIAAAGAELERYGYKPDAPRSVRDTVEKAEETPLRALVTDVRNKQGYTLLTLTACLAVYWDAASVEEALRTVVEGGGNTDTNGVAVGAIMGARFGLEGIPREWRDHVREIRDGRTPMEDYADRILDAMGMSASAIHLDAATRDPNPQYPASRDRR